jgi:hypothetical protein
MKSWTGDQLSEYLSNFRQEDVQEQILKAILDSELLKNAFESQIGNQVLNAAVEIIRAAVFQIVNNAMKDNDIETFRQSAMEIRTVHKQMVVWASIIEAGKEHTAKMQ